LVKLRLWRGGKKKQPIYRIAVADSRTARNGKYIEAIGQYNPGLNPIGLTLKEDRLYLWLKRGAQPTDTVRSLLQRKGLWLKWGLMKKGADEATIAAAFEGRKTNCGARWNGKRGGRRPGRRRPQPKARPRRRPRRRRPKRPRNRHQRRQPKQPRNRRRRRRPSPRPRHNGRATDFHTVPPEEAP
jgi:small subunit ribosomal protein S16